jgi:hypothetical protein
LRQRINPYLFIGVRHGCRRNVRFPAKPGAGKHRDAGTGYRAGFRCQLATQRINEKFISFRGLTTRADVGKMAPQRRRLRRSIKRKDSAMSFDFFVTMLRIHLGVWVMSKREMKLAWSSYEVHGDPAALARRILREAVK